MECCNSVWKMAWGSPGVWCFADFPMFSVGLRTCLCGSSMSCTDSPNPALQTYGFNGRPHHHQSFLCLEMKVGPLCQVQKSDGGGLSLQQDDMKLNDTQFREPHTGILYTPPKMLGKYDTIASIESSLLIASAVMLAALSDSQCY